MPEYCPVPLPLPRFPYGKHSAPSRTPFRQATKTVRLPTGIGVHFQTGILFDLITTLARSGVVCFLRIKQKTGEGANDVDYRLRFPFRLSADCDL